MHKNFISATPWGGTFNKSPLFRDTVEKIFINDDTGFIIVHKVRKVEK